MLLCFPSANGIPLQYATMLYLDMTFVLNRSIIDASSEVIKRYEVNVSLFTSL